MTENEQMPGGWHKQHTGDLTIIIQFSLKLFPEQSTLLSSPCYCFGTYLPKKLNDHVPSFDLDLIETQVSYVGANVINFDILHVF